MNKRYMDFVPVSATHKIVRDDVDEPVKPVAEKAQPERSVKMAEKKASEPQFGVIEDLQSKFVKTEVVKRPLNGGVKRNSSGGDNKKTAEEEKVLRNAVRKAESAVKNESEPKKRIEMKTPFVNTEKVTKRPLSKNVYQKKVVEPKEESSKSITIITSEKKDSKVGIVVAVIITIILGATAGTVAFLLLPK